MFSTLKVLLELLSKGSFTNYIDKILAFFDHLPTKEFCNRGRGTTYYVDILYGINIDKKWTF